MNTDLAAVGIDRLEEGSGLLGVQLRAAVDFRHAYCYSATIWVGSRIASHIDAPGCDRLPHLFCSWLGLRRRPGAEMAGVSERPASSAGTSHVIGVL